MDCSTADDLYLLPPAELWETALNLPTPAVLYDINALRHVVGQIQADISILSQARLNVALKACHTPAILKELSRLGVGCDVASTGELALALDTGFSEISATGPAFSVKDFELFQSAGVIVDVDSLSQLKTYGSAFPGAEVGVRLRIPLPSGVSSNATFGAESRFGINVTDKQLFETIAEHHLRVTRIHVHSGQTTPKAALYKLDYLLTAVEALPDVGRIDLGGGLFHFYVDRSAACAALSKMALHVDEFCEANARSLEFRFEPGGALLAPCGYLVAEVRAVEYHQALRNRIVTIDASAWNLAPWHKPQVFVLPDRGGQNLPGLLAGNTLYEHDFFGRDIFGEQPQLSFPECKVGDRVIVTAFGAYTMTNGRRFNRIPMPREFAIDESGLLELAHVDGSC